MIPERLITLNQIHQLLNHYYICKRRIIECPYQMRVEIRIKLWHIFKVYALRKIINDIRPIGIGINIIPTIKFKGEL